MDITQLQVLQLVLFVLQEQPVTLTEQDVIPVLQGLGAKMVLPVALNAMQEPGAAKERPAALIVELDIRLMEAIHNVLNVKQEPGHLDQQILNVKFANLES